MTIKLIEIRDRATCIHAMAVHIAARTEGELFALQRAGYAVERIVYSPSFVVDTEPYILLSKLNPVEAQYDPFAWPNQRTLGTAHRWLIEHWREVKSGDVVDVEFILGETQVPKRSERLGETNIVRTLGDEGRIVP